MEKLLRSLEGRDRSERLSQRIKEEAVPYGFTPPFIPYSPRQGHGMSLEVPTGLKSCNQHSTDCTVLCILDLKEEPGTSKVQVTFSESL